MGAKPLDWLHFHESETPTWRWKLVRNWEDAIGPATFLGPGLDAMFAVASGLFEPLELSAEIGWLDPVHGYYYANYPPFLEWRLARRRGPHNVLLRNWPTPETLEYVDAIDRAAAETFVRRACEQVSSEPDEVACPLSLAWSAVRIPIAEPVPADATELRMGRTDGGPATLPIERDERGPWISGPQDGFITPPLAIRVSGMGLQLDLEIAVYWSPWGEDGRPGTAAVEDAAARVEALGWQVEET